jgi:hypothetical protein
MKRFKLNYAMLALCFVLVAGITGYTVIAAQEKKQEVAIVGQNYLYIEEIEIAAGRIPNEAIAEAQGWVKSMRETCISSLSRRAGKPSKPVLRNSLRLSQALWKNRSTGAPTAITCSVKYR